MLMVPNTVKDNCVSRRKNMVCHKMPGWLGLESWGPLMLWVDLLSSRKMFPLGCRRRAVCHPPTHCHRLHLERERRTLRLASKCRLQPLLSPAACTAREPALHQLICRAQLPAHIFNFQWFDHRGQNFGQGVLPIA